jgi:hypothetical protein
MLNKMLKQVCTAVRRHAFENLGKTLPRKKLKEFELSNNRKLSNNKSLLIWGKVMKSNKENTILEGL